MSTKKKEFLNETKRKFYEEIKEYQKNLKPTKEIEGFGSIPIVGEKSYPYLSTHSVSNENKKNSFFNSSNVVKENYDEIIKLKAKNILGSTNKAYIKHTDDRIAKELRDIYKSKVPIEFNSKFEEELKFNKVLVNNITGITGSKNPLISLKSNENSKTSKQIEKYSVNDLKAKEAIIKLYERGTNEHQIIHLLALGSFGVQINKKLVPTRWAISAYDKTIEQHIQREIIKYKTIESYEVYKCFDKGNYFIIILMPEVFTCEVIEAFPGAIESDYVDHSNKLNKKEPDTSGGFYATKISVFESLKKRKRQASIISIRIIDDYDIPLGVVFVREAAREAIKIPILKTNSKKEFEEFLESKYYSHFKLYKNSTTLKESKRQTKLREFS